ncbi:Trimethyllysine dioxygenase [Pisolithus croceorrhizus]|nr:Trimethyllysine dioxygenase [Pisolithus croceorrhizus]
MQANNVLWICRLTSRKGIPSCVAQKFHLQRCFSPRTAPVRSNSTGANHRYIGFNGSIQGRLKESSATASQPVSSDQLEFIPEATANPGQKRTPIVRVDDGKVSVLWSPQNWSRFHHIWLRDHCRCPSCFHPVTKQRLVNTFQIPRDIKPAHHHASMEGLEIVWTSPSTTHHSSFYSWSWLREHTYDPPQRLEQLANEKVLWGAKIARSPPTVVYEEAMEGGDAGLYKWLSTIDRFGFCFVSGVPPTAEATQRLCERIAFIRETQYGKFWEFTADLAKGDTAYTSMALGAHTDTTYFTDPCGIQLFHLLSHTDGSGGTTLLVDGFYVALLLKELHPDHYDILSRVPVPAHASGEPTALYRSSPPSGYPTLQHDTITGELTQVRWNNDDRDVMSRLRREVVEKWYDAIRAWHTLLVSPDSEYWVQLVPGTVLSVNNHRILHGRSKFDGKRRVCGAYIGMDEYRSKLTVLQEKFDH